jgi:uncharacterized protein with FMN-binding domain
MKTRSRQNSFVRAVKKFLLSAFVVITFTAYALENRATVAGHVAQVTGGAIPTPTGATTTAAGTPDSTVLSTPTGAPTTAAGTPDSIATSPAAATPTAGVTATSAAPSATPTAGVTATSTAPSSTSSGYKDGAYTGPVVDVNWGYVQVQATIQSGKISNVQFLQYPSDRRTSVRINSIANPELEQEAIQAQSANVDIITGATLTSEGFQMSLQAALNQARG